MVNKKLYKFINLIKDQVQDILFSLLSGWLFTLAILIIKESIIGDVLDNAPETAQFFFEIGMHCLGCPSARGESIEQACAVHGTDADALVEKINAFLA